MHVRQQIREAVTTLLTGLITTGANVSANRVYPYNIDALPALNIRTDGDAHITDYDSLGAVQVRELELIIEARAMAADTVDDTLDAIASEIEQALASEPKLGGLLRRLDYASMEVKLDGEGEQLVGRNRSDPPYKLGEIIQQ